MTVLLDSNSGWVKVHIGGDIGGIEGYMESQYLSISEEDEIVIVAIPTATVKTPGGIILRENPERVPNSLGLGAYDNGTVVQVLGVSEMWCHVQVDDKTGFMMTEHLSPNLSFQ